MQAGIALNVGKADDLKRMLPADRRRDFREIATALSRDDLDLSVTRDINGLVAIKRCPRPANYYRARSGEHHQAHLELAGVESHGIVARMEDDAPVAQMPRWGCPRQHVLGSTALPARVPHDAGTGSDGF